MFASTSRLKKHEKIIFIAAILLTFAVFYFINNLFMPRGMILWAFIETAIMWLIIISLLLLADNQRVLNEELKQILLQNIEESKTLKEISKEQLQEIKLLNGIAHEAMKSFKRKK